jgi:eukaryotic-like serine/threonine-protein kinase
VIRRDDEPKLTTPTIVGHQRVSPPRAEPPRGDDDTVSWDPAEAAPGTPPEQVGPGAASGPTPLLRRVAQFVLLERLGAGGMGVVFAAFDEKLERKVAIKLVVTQGSDERAHQRLLREAQAQGRLSHPNVVTVYEVGTLPEGRLFIAMELVKGQTLRGWQQSGTRSWQDLVERYAAAGDGLAAAHRAGIVHRDFKPDNVLVGDDGRVRVADFGLAFAAEAELPPPDPSERPSGERSRPALTAVGAVLGTPGYMAPEQFGSAAEWRRGSIDARTDQFSFCVALYEALHGERPNADLAFANGARPPLRRAEPDPTYPRWLWDVLMRGLAHDPAARFPSMDALLAELTRSRARIRRRVLLAVGLVGVLAIAGVASAALLGGRAPEPCPLPTGELAGVWDAVTKQRVQAALLGTGTPFAANVWASTQAAFDRYARHWMDAQQAACEATHVRHVQSAELLDRRVECLAGRRRSLAAATEVLQSRPAQAVAHAGEVLSSLGDIDLCADTGVLLELGSRVDRKPTSGPAGAMAQARVAEVRRNLASATALLATGDVIAAEQIVASAEQVARDLDNEPVHAEVYFLQGRLKLARGELAPALVLFDRAVELAVASHHDELTTDVWLGLATTAGGLEHQPAEFKSWLAQGEAWIHRLGHASDSRRVEFERARAYLQRTEGHTSVSLATLTHALETGEALWGTSDPRLIPVLRDRATVHGLLQHAKLAVADAERALAIGIAAWGPKYPDIAWTRRALGLLYVEQLGDTEHAEHELSLALELYREQLGSDSIQVANCEQGLSQVYKYRGDYAGALEHAERADEIYARQLGPAHPRRGESLMGVGVLRFMHKDFAGSYTAYQAAYPILRTAFGANTTYVGVLLSNTGETLLALGKPEAAQRDFAQALEILQRSLGPDDGDLALPLKGLGLALLSRGLPRDAEVPLERALGLTLRVDAPDPQELAEIRWGLARALRASGNGARARELAEAAIAGYRTLGSESADRVREVTRWLATGR